MHIVCVFIYISDVTKVDVPGVNTDVLKID
jgi:hypothetical protein